MAARAGAPARDGGAAGSGARHGFSGGPDGRADGGDGARPESAGWPGGGERRPPESGMSAAAALTVGQAADGAAGDPRSARDSVLSPSSPLAPDCAMTGSQGAQYA